MIKGGSGLFKGRREKKVNWAKRMRGHEEDEILKVFNGSFGSTCPLKQEKEKLKTGKIQGVERPVKTRVGPFGNKLGTENAST